MQPSATFFGLRIQLNCFVGSCGGRGPRCSGWFADYIAEKEDTQIQSLTLAGGIKGWVKGGQEYTKNVDGYEAKYWK